MVILRILKELAKFLCFLLALALGSLGVAWFVASCVPLVVVSTILGWIFGMKTEAARARLICKKPFVDACQIGKWAFE